MKAFNEQNLLNKLSIFKKVAELGSVTRAAEAMSISKAAISRTIRQLEESIGFGLLVRTTRKITLTEEGLHLLAQTEPLFIEYSALTASLSAAHEQPKGRLRICAFNYFVQNYLLDLIPRYLKKYPEVQIDLITEEHIPNMERDSIDIMFGISIDPPFDVVAKKIGEAKFIFCASPKYLKKYGTPLKLSELKNHSYIEHSGRVDKHRVSLSKQVAHLHLKPLLSLNSSMLIKEFIKKDLGIGLLHNYFVEDEIKSGKLVPILENLKESMSPIYIFYQKHRFVQPKIRKFIELIDHF